MSKIYYDIQKTDTQKSDMLTLRVYDNLGETIYNDIYVSAESLLSGKINNEVEHMLSEVESIINTVSNTCDRFNATIVNRDSNETVAFIHISTKFERTYKCNKLVELFTRALNC